MSELARYLLESGGLWGLIALGLSTYLLRRDKELERVRALLETEHAARLLDAKENTAALLSIAQRTHEALEVLSDHYDRGLPPTRNGRTSRPL